MNNNFPPAHLQQQYPQQNFGQAMPMHYMQQQQQPLNMQQPQQQQPLMNMPASRVNDVPNLQQFAQNTQQPLQMPGGVLPPTQNKQQTAAMQQQNNDPSEEKPPQQFNYRQEEPGEDNQLADGEQGDNFEEARGRRRSKNDVDGRDHKCKYCDKTYLSYPALYTHTKQKHSTGPDGEQRAPPTSGRGRGRPRKNTYQRTDPKSNEYFYALERRGGPVDPIQFFEELFELILKGRYGDETMQSYPLFVELSKFSRADKSGYQKRDEALLQAQIANAEKDENREEELVPYEPSKLKQDGVSWQQKGWRHDYDTDMNLDEKTRNQMLIDETFAVYLYKISLKTNPSFYRVVLAFVIFFRECLNHIGWTKRIQSDEIDLTKHPEIQEKMKTTQFCQANTAEHAPEICNEFVTVYMEDNRSVFSIDRVDCIDLTINLCHWLFENQFTCSRLTMIQ